LPIPVDVWRSAGLWARRTLESLGGRGSLRQNASKDGLAVTSHGSLVLDMTFEPTLGSKMLDEMLNATPGVVEHGIFRGLASAVFIAENGRVQERLASVY
jgi:ribose 5-phosphate isomerase A